MTAVALRFAAGLLALAVTILLPLSALAEKRVALVIGNSNYRHVPSLANSANDARLMAETLRGLGFTLVEGGAQLDLDEAGLRRAVQAFGAQLQGANVGLFYYAGHGIQVRGANYLVPIGANPTKEADIDFQMLDTNLVLRQMESAGTRLSLVILDACRNNPFGGRGLRSTDSGLAQMRAPQGTLISFATQPGNVALDGSDRNSPYTKALAEVIRRPGLDIFQTFNEVGLAVYRTTGGAQQPWVSSSPISGSFYFAGLPAAPAAASAPSQAVPVDPDAAARRDYEFAEKQNTREVWEEFLRKHPTGIHAAAARQRLVQLIPPVPPTKPPASTQPVVGVFGANPLSAAQERALQPKQTFKECDTCPEMVVVPAGSFTMGSPASESDRFADEGPQRRVTFSRQFAVGKFAVTFDEWETCVADGGCNAYQPSDNGWGRSRRPVINVSWNDAKAYVAWLSHKTGKTYRLSSEAEREYVARAGSTTPFWWGSTISTSQANYDGNHSYGGGSKGEYRQKTLPVNSLQPNPWGLYHVHGNAWEWTEDCWNGNYSGARTDGSAWTTGDCSRRVLRGGSWNYFPWSLRSASRLRHTSDVRYYGIGFRVARTLTP